MNIDTLLVPRIGMCFIFKQSEYEITFMFFDKVRITSVRGGVSYEWSIDKLNRLYDNNEIKITFNSESIISNEKDIKTIKRKLKYIQHALLTKIRPQSKTNLENTINYLSIKINDNSPPTTRTLSTWIKKFKLNNCRIDSLIDNRKGNSTPRKNYFIILALEESLKIYDGTATLSSAQDVLDNINQHLSERNINYNQDDLYTLRSIQRFIKKYSDPYKKDKSKNGYRHAQQHVRASGKSIISQGIMYIIEFDSHKLDIIILDENTFEVTDRPYITVAIDIYSRVIVGFYISLSPANSYTSLQALKDMITRPSRGKMGGIPTLIVPDNGSENMNHSFLRLCENLGITITPAQKETPDNKAYIENYFKTLTHGLIQKIPGTTFSSPEDREKYNSSKFASITLEQLELYIKNWIDIYHQSLHSGSKRVPQSVWNQEIEKSCNKGVSENEADILCRIPHARDLNNGRVLYDYIYYYSHALKTYEIKGYKQVIILVNESDLSYIYVQLPDSTIIKANSTLPEYTDKLTLQEHKATQLIKRKLKLNDLENFPQEVNIFARIKLRQLINRDIKNNIDEKRLKNLKKTIQEWQPTISEEKKPIIRDEQEKIVQSINFGDFESFGYELLEINNEL
ncbi:DDE-type integrase/transposase/recombinase [Acinetobacter calcoaceticus]|uniref:DDE-type integrase/transposase/recombinase n=1 Tax=Acinetobacter calcoaceticus TaxID=471 RepID=UPI00300BBCE0